MASLATFYVSGRPRTKGSMKVITPRGRKPVMIEDHAHSLPWRKTIVKAIQEQVPGIGRQLWAPYDCPVLVSAWFYFDRVGKTAQTLPFPTLNSGVNANGDIDKLARNLLDAMKDARLIKDDSQVVDLLPRKRWAFPAFPAGIYVDVYQAEDVL